MPPQIADFYFGEVKHPETKKPITQSQMKPVMKERARAAAAPPSAYTALPTYAAPAAPNYDALIRAQEASFQREREFQLQQQELVKARQRAEISGDISRFQQELGTRLGEFSPRLGEIEAGKQYSLGQLETSDALQRAQLSNQFVERGLGTSGISLGGQSRREADALQRKSGVELQAQQQAAQVQRTMDSLKAQNASQIAALEARLRGLA